MVWKLHIRVSPYTDVVEVTDDWGRIVTQFRSGESDQKLIEHARQRTTALGSRTFVVERKGEVNPMTTTCHICGYDNKGDARFCGACGVGIALGSKGGRYVPAKGPPASRHDPVMEEILALESEAEGKAEFIDTVAETAGERAHGERELAVLLRHRTAIMRRHGITDNDLAKYVSWRSPVGQMEEYE